MTIKNKIPVLSFFTGGGFLDMGFEKKGFDVVWANECNERYIELYKHGYTAWQKSRRRGVNLPYLDERSVEEIPTRSIIRRAFPYGKPELFGIIGGPPCPDFSSAGRHAGKNGTNGKLTKCFVEVIQAIKPAFFVLENVSGLFKYSKHRPYLETLISKLEETGYIVYFDVLNALEFGVPQHRERLFVVGFLRKRMNINGRVNGDWFSWPRNKKYEGAHINFSWPEKNKFGEKPRKPRNLPRELCVGEYMLRNSELDKIPNGNNYFNPYSKYFKKVDEGDTSRKSFKRLHRYRYSPTACYGNNEVHLHPSEPRRISLREAMRIQGIPDGYILPEDISLQASFKMVSNGVPVPLAEHLAESIKKHLENHLKQNIF